MKKNIEEVRNEEEEEENCEEERERVVNEAMEENEEGKN